MKGRVYLPAVVAAAMLVAPLAAFGSTVTTTPLGQAPTLGMPMLGALALVLIGFGIYRIRTRSAARVARFALVAGLSLLAGLSYATAPALFVQGAQCTTQTTQTFGMYGSSLTSLCPNPIEIVAIATDCDTDIAADVASNPSLPLCTVTQVLATNDKCWLQGCKTW